MPQHQPEEDDVGYPIHLVEEVGTDGSRHWLALHPDLPGCNATGSTQAEAVDNLEKSRDAWLSAAAARGMQAPSPSAYAVSIEYARDLLVQQTAGSDAGAPEGHSFEVRKAAAA